MSNTPFSSLPEADVFIDFGAIFADSGETIDAFVDLSTALAGDTEADRSELHADRDNLSAMIDIASQNGQYKQVCTLVANLSLRGSRFWEAFGYYEDAKRHLQTGIEAATALNRPLDAAIFHMHLGFAHEHTNDIPAAQQAYQTAHNLARQTGSSQVQANSLLNLGRLAVQQEAFSRADRDLNNALRHARNAGDRICEIKCLITLAQSLHKRHKANNSRLYAQARDHLETARRLAKQVSDPRLQFNVLFSLGELAFKQMRHKQALGYFAQAADSLAACRDSRLELELHTNRGLCALKLGQLAAAQRDLEAAAERASKVGTLAEIGTVQFNLALVYSRQSNTGQALCAACDAMHYLTGSGQNYARQMFHNLRSEGHNTRPATCSRDRTDCVISL